MIAVSLSALAIWIYLLFARGGFWLGRERDDTTPSRLAVPPKVAIVVPARNEAENTEQRLSSLLAQNDPACTLVLFDDDSTDGTADIARRTAAALGKQDRLIVVS